MTQKTLLHHLYSDPSTVLPPLFTRKSIHKGFNKDMKLQIICKSNFSFILIILHTEMNKLSYYNPPKNVTNHNLHIKDNLDNQKYWTHKSTTKYPSFHQWSCDIPHHQSTLCLYTTETKDLSMHHQSLNYSQSITKDWK